MRRCPSDFLLLPGLLDKNKIFVDLIQIVPDSSDGFRPLFEMPKGVTDKSIWKLVDIADVKIGPFEFLETEWRWQVHGSLVGNYLGIGLFIEELLIHFNMRIIQW